MDEGKEIGQGFKVTRSVGIPVTQEKPVMTDRQRELVGRAMGEVDGVYGGMGSITTANSRFNEDTRNALHGVDRYPLNASPREEGYRQVTDLFESVGTGVRSALNQLDEEVGRSKLSDSLRKEIEEELMQLAFSNGELAQQHGGEAIRQFEQLVGRVTNTSKELSQQRSVCVRRSSENEEESSSLSRRFPSELTEEYSRASRRLAETANGLDGAVRRVEEDENIANQTRKGKFNQVVEELIRPPAEKEIPNSK